MRISAVKVMSIITIAAVAALGAEYASAAPSHNTTKAPTTSSSVVHNGGTLQTVPLGVPRKNIAHVYSTSTTGGTGEVIFTIPNPVPGVYAASFTANFFPAGTPSAPETFSCFITQNGSMRAQSTVSTGYSSGFYAGVNGGNTIRLVAGDVLNLGCGTADGSSWTFGTQLVQATLTRLDGMTSGTVSAAAHKSGAASATAH